MFSQCVGIVIAKLVMSVVSLPVCFNSNCFGGIVSEVESCFAHAILKSNLSSIFCLLLNEAPCSVYVTVLVV